MTLKSIFCVAISRFQAEHIVEQLRNAGFSNGDVSALFPEKEIADDFAWEELAWVPNGAVKGFGTGGVLGSAIGWLAGIGLLAIPGAGPLVVAGPLVATLSGAALGAAVGGIAGGLMHLGIPEPEARQYENEVRNGNILIAVYARGAEQLAAARKIFLALGALDIFTGGETLPDSPLESSPTNPI